MIFDFFDFDFEFLKFFIFFNYLFHREIKLVEVLVDLRKRRTYGKIQGNNGGDADFI